MGNVGGSTIIYLMLGFAFAASIAEGGELQELDEERVDVMRRKMEATVLPEVFFVDSKLSDVLAELEKLSREHDPWAAGEDKTGVKLSWKGGEISRRVDFENRDVPLIGALRYLAERMGTKFDITSDGAEFEAAKDGEFVEIELKVPPGFRSFSIKRDPGDAIDPFGGRTPNPRFDKPQQLSARRVLIERGIALKDCDSAYHHQGVLRVRASPRVIRHVENLVGGLVARSREVLRIELELFEMSHDDAAVLVESSIKKPSSGLEWEAAKALVEKGKAKRVALPALIAGSGQRAKVEKGRAIQYIMGFEVEGGEVVPYLDYEFYGTVLEVDPVISNDGATIDMNLFLDARFGEPKIVRRKVRVDGLDKEFDVEVLDGDARRLSTAVTTVSGQTQLIGSLSSGSGEGTTALAFLTTWITRGLAEDKE